MNGVPRQPAKGFRRRTKRPDRTPVRPSLDRARLPARMVPPTRCSICTHPRRHDIDERLHNGEGVKAIARVFGVTHQSLLRHRDGGEAHWTPRPEGQPRVDFPRASKGSRPASKPSAPLPEGVEAGNPRKTRPASPAERARRTPLLPNFGGKIPIDSTLPKPENWHRLVDQHGKYAEVALLRTREEREAYVALLIHHGRWDEYRTIARLALLWQDLGIVGVGELAARVGSVMCHARGSRQVRTLVLHAQARRILRATKAEGDHRTSLRVLEFMAKLDGLGVETDTMQALLHGHAWRVIAPIVERHDPELFAKLYEALVADEGRRRAAARVLDLGAQEGPSTGQGGASGEGTGGEAERCIDAAIPAEGEAATT